VHCELCIQKTYIFEKKWKMQYKGCAVPYFEWIDTTQCVAGFSTRRGGVSQGVYASMNVGLHSKDDHELVVANRKNLFSTVAQELKPVNLHQIHSADIIRVEKDYEKEVQADGFYTTERGVLLTISIADCGSVLFHDDDFTVVGALHCGWRGTRDGVIQNMLRELLQFVEPQKLSAYIGPMISKENYEVGPEFQEYFPTEFLTARNNSLYLDLNGCVEAILREGNVGKIYNAQLDTFSNPDLFFSYRRDGQTGRMCSFIGLK